MAGATPYQEMLGTLAGGYYLSLQALAALPSASDDDWMAAKVATAHFYAIHILPKVYGLKDAAVGGSRAVFGLDEKFIGAVS
jgi:hypothetical protein